MSRKQPFWICLQQNSGCWRCRKNWTHRNGIDAQFTGCDAIVPQLNTMLTDVEDLPRINELAKSLQELKARRAAYKIQSCGRCDAV